MSRLSQNFLFWSDPNLDFHFVGNLGMPRFQLEKRSFGLRKLNVILVPEKYLQKFARSALAQPFANHIT
jgi:hypothetical protein